MTGLRILIVSAAFLSLPWTLRAQSSESRYTKELVFPRNMKNISLGASPAIMRRFMTHIHDDKRLSLTIPPVHLLLEKCIWDLGNAGSIGEGMFISYGKYRYAYDYNDGYGGKTVNVDAAMTQVMVGMNYHYTIRTRFEAYMRLMFGSGIGSFDSDRAGAVDDWNAKFIWNGVIGMRHFFSNSFGLYAEGGYTSGCVNAGITYRW